jgi:hypothetical protein
MCLFHWRKLPKRLQAPFWTGTPGAVRAANEFFKEVKP